MRLGSLVLVPTSRPLFKRMPIALYLRWASGVTVVTLHVTHSKNLTALDGKRTRAY